MSDQMGASTEEMQAEHDVTIAMAGNVESVRLRLCIALEQLGYRVISENPLRARHGAVGWASAYLSANALEYPTQLEISLRSQGQGTTQVTFDYQVEHSGIFTEGDCQTLTREAEAIAALASQLALQVKCAGCGAEVAGEARFCRKCGAPSKTRLPAELDVLRLTAGARAGYQWIVTSLLIFLGSAVFPTIAALLDKPVNKFLYMAALIDGFGVWALAAGLRRLHLTLNPKPENEKARLSALPRMVAAPITNELPATPYAVTERTTDLLPLLPEAQPISRQPDKEVG